MRRFVGVGVLLSLVLTTAGSLYAQEGIRQGVEAEVEALFQPLATGQVLAGGWRFEALSIDRDRIKARLAGPAGSSATVIVSRRGEKPNTWTTPDFSVGLDEGADERATPAALELVARLRANDAGGHWERWLVGGDRWDWLELARQVGRAVVAPPARILALLALLLVLAWRATRGEPRVRLGLLAVVAFGAVLRWWSAPTTFLAQQPIERLHELTNNLMDWTPFQALLEAVGARPLVPDLTFGITFVFAVVGPIALFLAARHLLGDSRSALFAAFCLAVLPLHIRFSRSESTFVPDLVADTLTVALAATVLRDRARWVVGLAFLALPLALALALELRPTNVLLLALVPALVLTTPWREGTWPRRLLVVVAAPALALALGWDHSSFPEHSSSLSPGSVSSIGLVLRSLFDWRRNTWIDVSITPPVVVLLAALGAVWLARQRQRAGLLLAAWFGALWSINVIVCSTSPRFHAVYMLHAAAPLLIIAGASWPTLVRLTRLPRTLLLASLVASPVAHLGFIRDLEYNDLEEYAFVTSNLSRIPDGCTVLEYVGEKADPSRRSPGYRFGRLGARPRSEEPASPDFRPVPAVVLWRNGERLDDVLEPEVRDLVQHPPACLIYYEGLLCYAEKETDDPLAPFCTWMRARLPSYQLLAEREFPSRMYDADQAYGLSASRIHLGLYRAPGGP